MSLGVALLSALVERVGHSLDAGWDIEIIEMHHRMKADAPSGTALALGEAAARGRGVALSQVAARGRDGLIGPRKTGEIGFAALRAGMSSASIAWSFAAPGERIELAHVASDRAIFARGALQAAKWVVDAIPASTASMTYSDSEAEDLLLKVAEPLGMCQPYSLDFDGRYCDGHHGGWSTWIRSRLPSRICWPCGSP
jgi:4-hydroxy-tetrahydrodipicolinate reductase